MPQERFHRRIGILERRLRRMAPWADVESYKKGCHITIGCWRILVEVLDQRDACFNITVTTIQERSCIFDETFYTNVSNGDLEPLVRGIFENIHSTVLQHLEEQKKSEPEWLKKAQKHLGMDHLLVIIFQEKHGDRIFACHPAEVPSVFLKIFRERDQEGWYFGDLPKPEQPEPSQIPDGLDLKWVTQIEQTNRQAQLNFERDLRDWESHQVRMVLVRKAREGDATSASLLMESHRDYQYEGFTITDSETFKDQLPTETEPA